MTTDTNFRHLADRVAQHLLPHRKRLVTAESCTGGWLAKVITDLPGSSQWFECGYVTYSNTAKVRDLQVSERTLELHGAVSEATAREMAAGALHASGADLAIAITGIAGPDGGTADKPVGTVWFGVAVRRDANELDDRSVRVQHFTGDRDSIRRDSVKFALEWLVAIQLLPAGTTV
jgi:nicotinamide-nucleotide amidase